MSGRIAHRGLRDKIVSAPEAAAHIQPGNNVGMSGFTGAGYPKAVPEALAAMMSETQARSRIVTGRIVHRSVARRWTASRIAGLNVHGFSGAVSAFVLC